MIKNYLLEVLKLFPHDYEYIETYLAGCWCVIEDIFRYRKALLQHKALI